MSDELPEHLKAKLLKRIMEKAMRESMKKSRAIEDPEEVVWSRLSDEKARELMGKVKRLHPHAYPYVIDIFYRLIKQGAVKELDGYTTYILLHRIGVPVKPDLRIKFVKHGKEVSFKDYVGD